MNFRAILKAATAVGKGMMFVVDKVRMRRKARLTHEQRDAAWSEASDRLDDMLDTKREKRPLK